LYHQALTPEDIYAAVNALTAEQLQVIAADIFAPDRLTTLIYQPQ
jgi:predicted Zn-dependent peptidase